MYLDSTMNNTKNILLMAVIASTLVMGTSVTPMQSYATGMRHKKKGDLKSSIKSNAESDKKSASQNGPGQLLLQGRRLPQANQGQQIVGKDNEAKGFNDQSRNIQSTPTTVGQQESGTALETTETAPRQHHHQEQEPLTYVKL